MSCHGNCSPSWTTILRNGLDYQKYVVRVVRHRTCCGESRCQIFVNDQELVDHQLNYNCCSPLCCMGKGGSYEWEQDGHRFLLMINKVSLEDWSGKYRLFVNGIDVESGREFSSLWRRKGLILLLVGLIIAIIFTLIHVLIYVVFKPNVNPGSFAGLYWITGFSIFWIIAGIILFVKYSTPKASPSAVLDYKDDQAKVV